MASVTHGGSEIKRSQKECTLYYYNISWVLNNSADLGLSHNAGSLGAAIKLNLDPHLALVLCLIVGWHWWCQIGSQTPFSPSPKCINVFLAGWMAPALGLPVCIQTPIPTVLPASQATCACGKLHLHPKSREVKEDTY